MSSLSSKAKKERKVEKMPSLFLSYLHTHIYIYNEYTYLFYIKLILFEFIIPTWYIHTYAHIFNIILYHNHDDDDDDEIAIEHSTRHAYSHLLSGFVVFLSLSAHSQLYCKLVCIISEE